MVDPKKPTPKPAPSTTTAVPATAERRPSLPPLSPVTGTKSATADVQPLAPAADTAASEKAPAPASAEAQAIAVQPSAPAKAAKPSETLAPKLRTKADILGALRNGARVHREESGLYRIVAPDGAKHPASKRRILALIEQGILKASGEGNGRIYVLDAEAEAKASEKKPTVKPEAPAMKPADKETK
jgi:hypothetical protein